LVGSENKDAEHAPWFVRNLNWGLIFILPSLAVITPYAAESVLLAAPA
jgi:hypothetical protein